MVWDINWGCPIFVANFRSGDPEVLATLYRQHLTEVAHVARNGFGTIGERRTFIPGLRQEHERDDLIQEVFSRAFCPRARLSFDPRRAFRPYLLAICRHALVDWHRARRQRGRLGVSFRDVMNAAGSEAAYVASDHERERLLETCVGTLDVHLRQIFEELVVHGRSQREAAAVLGISRQNVRTLERRLLAEIRRTIRI